MAYDPNVFAEMVALTIKAALTPVLERVAGMEARLAQALAVEPAVAALRDRVVVIETKEAAPVIVPELPELPDLSPVLERVAATEARVARLAAVELTLGELRDKCVTLETKAAMALPVEIPEPPDLDPILQRVDRLEARATSVQDVVLKLDAKAAEPHVVVPSGPSAAELELTVRDAVEPLKVALAAVQERIAVLEVRPLLPGPAGKDGAPGLDGKDGAPGQHGLAGLSYEGVYQEGKQYEPGHLATWGGSTWHCNESTTHKPGENATAWTLMVKRGRDGRDGKDAEIAPVVALGRR